MNEREEIFKRIREALTVLAPFPGHNQHQERVAAVSGHPTVGPRQWLPTVGSTFEERLSAFAKNAADLKADFCLVSDYEKLSASLLKLRDSEKWSKAATHQTELTDFVCSRLGLPVCRTDRGYAVEELESCSVGITECDALVAQTGSVLISSRSAGGRALSVLPPHHVVLARRNQLVADLPDTFALIKERYGSNYPSFISFITGPSRTGDIERILVLGAHGPKKLSIFCV